jgi:hypothetical protein
VTTDRTSRVAALAVGAVVFLAAAEPERLGIGTGGTIGGPDLRWWAFLALLAAPGLVALLFSSSTRRALCGAPVGWLFAATVWILLVSPFGWRGAADVATAAGLLAMVAFGAWIAAGFGWDWFVPVLARALLAFFVVGVVFQFALESDVRWQGLTAQANRLGFLAAIAVPVGLSEFVRRRPVGPALMAAALLMMLMANARTSLLAAGVGVLVWARPLIGRAVPAAATAVVLLGLSAVLVTGSVQQVSESAAREGDAEEITSLTGRTEVWGAVLVQIDERPFTGVGAGSTAQAMRTAYEAGDVGWDAGHGHNMALQFGLHGGWPAALLLVVSLASYWWWSRIAVQPVRDAVVAVVFIVGVTEDFAIAPSTTLLVYAVCLASLAVSRRGSGTRTGPPSRRPVAV